MTPWPFALRPRVNVTWQLRAGVSLAGVVVALLLGALLLAISGISPWSAYVAMADAAFLGGAYAWSDTATKATPLILCGLGCALAFKMRLWNVGAEGQLLLGAWVATGLGSIWLPPDTPRMIMLTCMAVGAMVVGALYGAIAGVLKARLGVSEILVTLMLVYVATQFNNFWIFSAWSQGGFPLTPLFPSSARLPRLMDAASVYPWMSGLTVHAGLLLALLIAMVVSVLQSRTRLGFELEVTGDNPWTARSAGIPVARNTVLVMALSGALAGLAGMVEVSGVVFRLQERFSPGYGFTAILVAWLARLHPAAVVLVSVLLGGLLVGSREVQPAGIGMMLQGLMLSCVVGGEFLVRYQVVRVAVPRGESHG